MVGSRKSSNTCNQCRSRKVKCDGKRDRCGSCERLGYACSFEPKSSLHVLGSHGSSLISKHRTREACVSCHALKARCSGDHPRCHRCLRKGADCVYVRHHRLSKSAPGVDPAPLSSHEKSPPSTPREHADAPTGVPRQDGMVDGCWKSESQQFREASESIAMPSKEVVTDAIDDFFRYIHPISCFGFLHKASILQGYAVGQTNTAFLLSLCGVTYGVLKPDSNSQRQAAYWIDCAELLVLKDLKRPSILKVQAALLIIYYKLYFRCGSSSFMLLGIAARFAFAMRLNYEDSALCFLAQESRRRAMWAIYVLDTELAGGLKEFTVCPVDTIHVQLPCREEDFELDNPQATGTLKSISGLPPPSKIGLLTHYIRIMDIRDRILRYTKQVACEGNDNAKPSTAVHDFEFELQLFVTSLPESLTFSLRNLRLRADSRWLPRYVMIHVWWHQCYCDLYRLLFSGLREAVSNKALDGMDSNLIAYCQSSCVEHARAMATEIFANILNLNVEPRVMDYTIAECAYQSARIILHAYRTNAERFSLGGDSAFIEIGYCSTILKKMCVNSPFAKVIEQQLEELVAGGQSPQSSSSERGSPPPGKGKSSSQAGRLTRTARSHQILSRHNIVKNAAFTDDSATLVASLGEIYPPHSLLSGSLPTVSHQVPETVTSMVRSDTLPPSPVGRVSMPSDMSLDDNNHSTFESRSVSTAYSFPMGAESFGSDWASNTAYQGAWEPPQSFFEPLTLGIYSQADEDMHDFMQGKWFN